MADSENTLRLHRAFKGPAERVYRAFLEPDALAKWLPPYGFTCKIHQMDARVGGTFRLSSASFSKGNDDSFHGTYLELVPHERIVYTEEFDDPNLPGVMTVTVTLRKIFCGTEMHIVQTGIPAAIPVEMCYLGWQESLAQLSRLVDSETPDIG